MPMGWAVMPFVQTARKSFAERPSRISCVSRLAAVSASRKVASSVTPAPCRSDGLIACSSARALICAAAPWAITTRMFSERSTATSRRIFAKFSSVTTAPSMLTMKIFSRNRGIYWSMPRRSVSFMAHRYGSLYGEIWRRDKRSSTFLRENVFQRAETALILLRGAHGNADKFRQLIAAHWPGDHTLLLEFFENMLPVAHLDQNEICRGRDK